MNPTNLTSSFMQIHFIVCEIRQNNKFISENFTIFVARCLCLLVDL